MDPNAGLAGVLGLRYLESSGERMVIEWDITEDQLQPMGLVHGGVFCAVIETAASYGGQLWLQDRGHIVGMSNQTDFIRAGRIEQGTLRAVATPIHQGKMSQLWVCEITDQEGNLLSRGQVRLANLTPRG